MKQTVFIVAAVCLILTGSAMAQHGGAQGSESCIYCGMDLQKFAHSAVVIEYEDGTVSGTCSLHCAAIDLALKIDKTPKRILVGDYPSKKQIDAVSACWTIGGDQPGVMTKRAKWAFENRAECEKYASEHGAKVTDFDESVKAAYEDMYADTKMIREKRKAVRERAAGQEKKQ